MKASGSYEGRYRYSFQSPKPFVVVRNRFRTIRDTRGSTVVSGVDAEGVVVGVEAAGADSTAAGVDARAEGAGSGQMSW
jgi:hypothetical protein